MQEGKTIIEIIQAENIEKALGCGKDSLHWSRSIHLTIRA